jgi:hypothetical protein
VTSPGERLFARYTHAPNALGYCGPAAAAGLQQVACGAGEDVDVRRLAAQFSGVWPYQTMMAELAGDGVDPLSEEVGRAYWTGNDLTARLDAERLGAMLLERFAAQAGHYWKHLDEDLLDEVTPTHAFHVLGVYPWTRLLHTGLPEPLHVLDSCRIRTGRVVSVDDDAAWVEVDTLTWDGRVLGLADPRPERVARRTPDGVFADLAPGDHAAIHWAFVCDQLTDDQAETLLALTGRQVELTNRRLAR